MATPSRILSPVAAVFTLVLIAMLAGCGGDDDVYNPPPPAELTGAFLDSSVEGLAYSTASSSGITNSLGEFVYHSGESITFRIGGIILGEAQAGSIMTPVSLVDGATSEENPTVTNIARLLLTLDDDANPDNSIEIATAVRDAAATRSVNFAQTPEAFGNDAAVRSLIADLTSLTQAGSRELVSADFAQDHLRRTLLGIYCGAYGGTYSGDDRGTWTVGIDSDGVLLGTGESYDETTFEVSGTVTSAGSVNFIGGVVSIGDVYFSGTVTYAGRISGSWESHTYPISGTFSGSKTAACTSPNNPPEIVFSYWKWAVPKTTVVTLTVQVFDPDNDPLTVTWEVTRDGAPSGSLNPQDQGKPSIRWTTPLQTGRDTIMATVSDGRGGTATIVETIFTATPKAGSVTASELWSKADSPYILTSATNFFAIEGATLILDPGVEIYVDKQGLNITVVGALDANGSEMERVAFRPNTRSPETGDWQGITASPSGQDAVVDLEYTDIRYAVDAIRANEVASVLLDGCRIMFSQENAILHESTGELRVEHCVITNNNRTGIRVKRELGLNVPGTVTISADSIAANGDLAGGTAYDDDAGIFIDLDDPNGTANIDINCTEISRNAFPGIQLANAVYPSVHHNAMFYNDLGKIGTRHNIRLADGFGGNISTIDARDNYWGAPFTNPADSTSIKQYIRDEEDGGGITVRVLIYEWLHEWPSVQCQY